jgi:ABC-type molybdate transport system substrate-binding protein
MFTNTPLEVLTLLAANKVDAGIHYNICPFKTDPGKISQGAIKKFASLPRESYPPIYNYIVVLNASKNQGLAKKFIDFIFSAQGQKILSKYGLDKRAVLVQKGAGESNQAEANKTISSLSGLAK